jgi:hypothetical protein
MLADTQETLLEQRKKLEAREVELKSLLHENNLIIDIYGREEEDLQLALIPVQERIEGIRDQNDVIKDELQVISDELDLIKEAGN